MNNKEKLILKSRNFKLVSREVDLPDGSTGKFDIIVHPGAVVIVPLLSKDKVVMIWQYRPAIDKYIYELPAGTLEKNERPLLCAKRELKEETGYKAARVKFIGDIIPVPGYSSEILKIFVADISGKSEQNLDEHEIIDVKIFSKREIRELFKSGKLVDAKSIAAFAMIGWL